MVDTDVASEEKSNINVDGQKILLVETENSGLTMTRLSATESVNAGDMLSVADAVNLDHDKQSEIRAAVESEDTRSARIVEVQSQTEKDAVFETTIDSYNYDSGAGEITVEYTVENTGSEQAEKTVEFTINGRRVNSTKQTLSAGGTASGTFTYDTSSRVEADPVEDGTAIHDGNNERVVTIPETHKTFEFERLPLVPEYDSVDEVPKVRGGDSRYSAEYNPRAIVRFTSNAVGGDITAAGLYSYSTSESKWVRIDRPKSA